MLNPDSNPPQDNNGAVSPVEPQSQGLPEESSSLPVKRYATRKLTALKRPRSGAMAARSLPSSIKNKIRAFSAMLDTQPEIAQPTDQQQTARIPLSKAKTWRGLLLRPSVLAVILIIAAFLGFKYITTLHMSTYKNGNFTISVPKGYLATNNGSFVVIKPAKSDGSYSINILLPDQQGLNYNLNNASDSTKQALLTLVEATLQRTAQQYLAADEQINNVTVTATKRGAKDAVVLNGEVQTNGKKTGKITALALFENQGIYTVIVNINVNNTKVTQKADTIINSFQPR